MEIHNSMYRINVTSTQVEALHILSSKYKTIYSDGLTRLKHSKKIAKEFYSYFELKDFIKDIYQGYLSSGIVLIGEIPSFINQNILCSIPATIFSLKIIQKFPLETRITPPELEKSPLYKTEELSLHTDFPFEAPESTTIYCKNSDPKSPNKGLSLIISADRLANEIRQTGDIELNKVAFEAPLGHLNFKKPTETNDPVPLIHPSKNELYKYKIRYNRQYLAPEYESLYSTTLDKVDNIARKAAFTYPMKKGDMIILNNQRYLHGRTEASYEENKHGLLNTREIFTIWGDKCLE